MMLTVKSWSRPEKEGGNRLVWLQFASSLVAEKTIHLKGEDKGKWYVHTQDMRCMWWGTL
jgi:hypothetical protein